MATENVCSRLTGVHYRTCCNISERIVQLALTDEANLLSNMDNLNTDFIYLMNVFLFCFFCFFA